MSIPQIWIDLSTIIASIATVVALAALAIEIRNSRNAEKMNAVFELDKKFQALRPDINKLSGVDWEKIEDFNEEYPPGSDERAALINLKGFFEMAGGAIFNGLIDKRLAMEEWGVIFLFWWKRLEPLINKERKTGSQLDLASFEWFALAFEKKSPRIGQRLLRELEKMR